MSLGLEGAAAAVDGVGVDVAVVADGGGDGGELLRRRAVRVHVAARDEGELGGGEESPGRDELVAGARPGRSRFARGIDVR